MAMAKVGPNIAFMHFTDYALVHYAMETYKVLCYLASFREGNAFGFNDLRFFFVGVGKVTKIETNVSNTK